MKISSADYVKSFVRVSDFDLPNLPAIAFVGRSNVGKSSLINALLRTKSLVKTSSHPGKTQMINVFMINRAFYFIDLPGYGFANVPVAVKNQWQKMIQEFIFQYPMLLLIIQLVDIRHPPSKEDIHFQDLLKSNQIPNLVVANKSDKIKKGHIGRSIKDVSAMLALSQPAIAHSAMDHTGYEEIWRQLESALAKNPKAQLL